MLPWGPCSSNQLVQAQSTSMTSAWTLYRQRIYLASLQSQERLPLSSWWLASASRPGQAAARKLQPC